MGPILSSLLVPTNRPGDLKLSLRHNNSTRHKLSICRYAQPEKIAVKAHDFVSFSSEWVFYRLFCQRAESESLEPGEYRGCS